MTAPKRGATIFKGGAMSDEQRKDEEAEVEGHGTRAGMNDEAGDDEVEGHVHRGA